MIDPKELRIGNYVSLKNGIHVSVLTIEHDVYSEIGYCIYDQNLCVRLLEDLSPIPITEEWLERFGFNPEYPCWYMDDIPFFIEQLDDQFRVSFEGSGGYAWNQKINSLHQLQNLYFALTGEELNIEL